jgi:hypothetical protein
MARGSGAAMRRDELMKPDMFSETLLLIVGAAIFMVLVSTLLLALFHS